MSAGRTDTTRATRSVPSVSRRWRHVAPLAAVLALAVIGRLANCIELTSALRVRSDARFDEPEKGTDQMRFLAVARGIVNGQGFGRRVQDSPLYPLVVLPGLYALSGSDVLATRLLQSSLAGLGTAWLVYLLGRRLCGHRVGLAAALLAAIHPPFVIYDAALLTEPVTNLTTAAGLVAIARLADHRGPRALILAGVMIGLAALAKPSSLILAPLAVVVLLRHRAEPIPRRLLRAAVVGLITLATIAPITIRNYRAAGEFILIRSNGAKLFLMGNNPTATGHFTYPRGEWADRERRAVQPVKGSPRREDAARFRLACEFIRDNPAHFLRLTLYKLGLFFSSYEHGNNLSVTYRRQITFLGWPVFPGFGWLLGFAVLAPVVARRCCRDLWLLYGFIGLHAVSTALFVVVSRYRLPATLCLTILAAAVAVRAVDWIQGRRWAPAAATLTAALVLVGALHSDQIYRALIPRVRPDGFVERTPTFTVIRDETGLKRHRFTPLVHPSMIVEKILMVPPDLLPAKEAWIRFTYAAESRASCVIELNGHPAQADLQPTSPKRAQTQVPAEWVVAGRNVIRFRTLGGSRLAIGVSGRFRFGRSRWRDAAGAWHTRYLDEESLKTRAFEHLVGGEYVIRLALKGPHTRVD